MGETLLTLYLLFLSSKIRIDLIRRLLKTCLLRWNRALNKCWQLVLSCKESSQHVFALIKTFYWITLYNTKNLKKTRYTFLRLVALKDLHQTENVDLNAATVASHAVSTESWHDTGNTSPLSLSSSLFIFLQQSSRTQQRRCFGAFSHNVLSIENIIILTYHWKSFWLLPRSEYVHMFTWALRNNDSLLIFFLESNIFEREQSTD